MDERMAAAEAALKAGRGADAIAPLIELLQDEPAQSAQLYRALLIQLYHARRHADGAHWSAIAVDRHPRDVEMWNIRGVMLRQLKRHPEAAEALDQALRLNPANQAAQMNRANVFLDMGDGPRAEAAFGKLARKEPRNAEFHRLLGRALRRQGKLDAALTRFRQAVALRKDNIDAWLDMVSSLNEMQRSTEAEEAADRALALFPTEPRLLESKAVVLRNASGPRAAEAYLQSLLPLHDGEAWLHYQLGSTISDYARDQANIHLRRAVALDPGRLDYLVTLIESLERTRSGDEGANIEEAYALAKTAMGFGMENFSAGNLKVLFEILVRVSAFDELDALGTVESLGRIWIDSGRHTALLKLLAQVKTPQDRHELIALHRAWGRHAQAIAARRPIRKPPPRTGDGRIRLGFLSSDLRRHPVGYFALPLFEHLDKERFEIFCYSFYQGQPDPIYEFIAQQSTYRWHPDINVPDAAQMIADDQLDILIELGGSTHMNKLEVMAYGAAPKQASWLGYPHSAGLETIDYLICDPYNTPPQPELLIEKPLTMPKSWIALGRMVFSEDHLIEPGVPQDKSGFITFGTANNPHKYNRAMIQVWAKVLLATPDSRFMFVRPEGGTASFRRNLLAEFAACGVDPERILFETIRGRHMPFYNKIDITLDTFPLTGGTTTTEALWMGVPVVSLVGEAFFERLSASILHNAGVGDMATTDMDEFVAIATNLAADRDRRLMLRHSLRDQIKASPLGQTEQFARDFYDLIESAVRPKA